MPPSPSKSGKTPIAGHPTGDRKCREALKIHAGRCAGRTAVVGLALKVEAWTDEQGWWRCPTGDASAASACAGRAAMCPPPISRSIYFCRDPAPGPGLIAGCGGETSGCRTRPTTRRRRCVRRGDVPVRSESRSGVAAASGGLRRHWAAGNDERCRARRRGGVGPFPLSPASCRDGQATTLGRADRDLASRGAE